MTFRRVWEDYKEVTQSLTDNARKIGYAGVAICWVLQEEKGGFTGSLFAALLSIVVYFVADLLQYLFLAVRIRNNIVEEEKEYQRIHGDLDLDAPYKLPAGYDTPSYLLFRTKLVFLIAGYGCLGLAIFL